MLQLHHYYMQERYRKSQEGKTAKWMETQNLKFDPRFELRMRNATADNQQQGQAEEEDSPPSPFQYREGEETQPINLVNWADEKEREEKRSISKKSAVKRPSSLVFNTTERGEDDESSAMKLRKRYITTKRCSSEPGVD